MPTDTPTKPKPPSPRAEPNLSEASACMAASRTMVNATSASAGSTMSMLNRSRDAVEASEKKLDKPPGKLGAEKLTPEEQRRRFEELAREAGCDEGSEAQFEAAVKTIGQVKLKTHKAAS